MFRRRRRSPFRRSSRRPADPRVLLALLVAAVLAVVYGFFHFIGVSDRAVPERVEQRIELPDAIDP